MLSKYCFNSDNPFLSLDATPGEGAQPGDACHQLHEPARPGSTETLIEGDAEPMAMGG